MAKRGKTMAKRGKTSRRRNSGLYGTSVEHERAAKDAVRYTQRLLRDAQDPHLHPDYRCAFALRAFRAAAQIGDEARAAKRKHNREFAYLKRAEALIYKHCACARPAPPGAW